MKLGGRAVLEVFDLFSRGKDPRTRQPDDGRYFQWPTAREVEELRKKEKKLLNIFDLLKVSK